MRDDPLLSRRERTFFLFVFLFVCLFLNSLLCLWNSPGKNTGMGCHSLLQGLFPTQGSNPGLLHCRWTLYCLSRQGRNPKHSQQTDWTRPHCSQPHAPPAKPVSSSLTHFQYCWAHREGIRDCKKGDASGGDGLRGLDSYCCTGVGGSPQSFVGVPANSFSNESNSVHLMECLLRA